MIRGSGYAAAATALLALSVNSFGEYAIIEGETYARWEESVTGVGGCKDRGNCDIKQLVEDAHERETQNKPVSLSRYHLIPPVRLIGLEIETP